MTARFKAGRNRQAAGPRRHPAGAGLRRRRGLPVLLTLAVLALAACAPAPRQVSSVPSPSQPSPPVTQAPAPQPAMPAPDTPLKNQSFGADGMVRVAFLAPLSGQAGGAGQALLNAAQMAAFDMGGERFVLQPYDTGGTPSGAAAAARQALSQGTRLILGPLYGNATRAVGPVAAGAGVNVVSFSTDPGVAGGNVFVMGYMLREQVDRVVTFAMSEGRSRFGVLAPATTYGQAAARTLGQQVRARGGEVMATQTYNPDNPDLREPARAMSGADAILVPDSGDGLRAAANGLAFVDIDSRAARMMGTMLWDDPGLWRESALAGGVFPAPSRSSLDKFESRYQQAFGAAPPDLAVLGYDAVALAAVLSQSGGGASFDRATLTSAAGFSGAAGIFRFRPDGTVQRGLSVMEIRPNGTVTEVSPAPLSFSGRGSVGF